MTSLCANVKFVRMPIKVSPELKSDFFFQSISMAFYLLKTAQNMYGKCLKWMYLQLMSVPNSQKSQVILCCVTLTKLTDSSLDKINVRKLNELKSFHPLQ